MAKAPKPTPQEKARAKAKAKDAKLAKKATSKARRTQLKQAFTVTRKADSTMLPLMAVGFLVPLAVFVLLGVFIGFLPGFILLGVLFGLLGAVAIFGRRVQKQAYSQVEGQLGAAAAVLKGMRGDWRVTEVVGVTREKDLLHRVVGKPGVILVAEGARNRTRTLVIAEKKKVARVIGETPVYDVSVGDGEGQVPLRQLERHLTKLPRNIKGKTVNEIDRRLTALGSAALPIPKGPIPTNGRVPRGKVR